LIRLEEIQEVAAKVRLTTQVVEKDYALGWFLAGVRQHPGISADWIFKGGTCLKKCYFETYRFSEDLDFSYRGNGTPTVEQLQTIFREIADWVFSESGLEIPKDTISFESFTNPRGTISIQGRAGYRGPVRPQIRAENLPKIFIDLTLDEPVVLEPVVRQIDHPYSDRPENGIEALSYTYEEIFAEKTRALAQRLKPRDLYDVIHLHRRQDFRPNQAQVRTTLESKCRLRGIGIPTMQAIESHGGRALLESEWERMLAHQLPTLPPFDQFLGELPQVFDWIAGQEEVQRPILNVSPPSESEGEVVQLAGPNASFLDRIRFAAANRLQVCLGYDHDFRNIEPYSLARSSDGNLLLRTIKSSTGEPRTYRFDRIESAEVTRTPFQPQYLVEITSSGHLPIHQLTRKPQQTSRETRNSGSGMTYVFRCTVCKKLFRRKSMDSTLKTHKAPSGRDCYGTYGAYVKTEW
jgi:predicted nucleotidyltransferase component of viral defense system